ncbi:DUF2789 family protein [Shewanella gaetbuli]|uniref:DUF2789 domain-containing protein n=1 Tax=Shewanella gaetbuli TaxID=220752 RepID=A0A9X1ZNY9_9GAMM|nr:DUF2789 family protein [Shewanella gaetbuli]MCL1143400.1 DUF2789 domain-containing protein [Shewanella gaetbuli]
MDTSNNNLQQLFQQLGLEHDDDSINEFIDTHQLAEDTLLIEASFWNNAQKAFIQEALSEDAQWAEVVDLLNVMLRKKPTDGIK